MNLNLIIIFSIGIFVFMLLQSNLIRSIDRYIPLLILLILLILIVLYFSNFDVILLESSDKD